MARLTQSARGAALALVLALVVAAPAAAAQPIRTVYLPNAHSDPAGTACAFQVDFSPTRGFNAYTDFSDGSERHIANVTVAITNDGTGTSFVHKARFNDTSFYEAATNTYHGVTDGQWVDQLLPGWEGPFGVVQTPSLYRLVGRLTWTWDDTVGAYTQYDFGGTVTDVCALLS